MDDRADAAADAIDVGVGDDAAAVRTLRGVALADRAGRFDIELRDTLIADVRPAAESGDVRWLALPAFVNFHTHADRAFAAPSQRPGKAGPVPVTAFSQMFGRLRALLRA